jgi:D-3-phosphoglycerate dehydrogenase
MQKNPYFIIDFDSTFTRVEALDVLAELVLAHSSRKDEVVRAIREITNRGMNGELNFRESLSMRLDLLKANRDDILHLGEQLKLQISPSFERNQKHLAALKETVYVVSNGFKEFIVPVIAAYGLLPENVYANTFIFDEMGYIIGFDTDNPLSGNSGKSKVIKNLRLNGDVYVIGDGANDLEIWKAGYANKFYLFTENVEREKVKKEANHTASTVDEILYELNLGRSLSYPKTRIKVLLLEGISKEAAPAFEEEGYQVELMDRPLNHQELAQKLKSVNILGLTSRQELGRDLLKYTKRLISLGVFSSDASKIDLEACSHHGVAVFNAPFSHVRSVGEFTLGRILDLSRAKENRLGREIRGKRLGIIGYGKVGSQLGVLAENLGMEVSFFDIADKSIMGNSRKCANLDFLLNQSDFVSIHVSELPENKHFFGKSFFDALKPTASLLYCGNIEALKLESLYHHLQSFPSFGCSLDLNPDKLSGESMNWLEKIKSFENILFSPGISANTIEAEQYRARFIPEKITEYLNSGNTMGALNFPNLFVPALKNAHRLLHIHKNVPNVLARINQIFAAHQINILAQSLKTTNLLGYVVTDVDMEYPENLLDEMRNIEETIWFRVLY